MPTPDLDLDALERNFEAAANSEPPTDHNKRVEWDLWQANVRQQIMSAFPALLSTARAVEEAGANAVPTWFQALALEVPEEVYEDAERMFQDHVAAALARRVEDDARYNPWTGAEIEAAGFAEHLVSDLTRVPAFNEREEDGYASADCIGQMEEIAADRFVASVSAIQFMHTDAVEKLGKGIWETAQALGIANDEVPPSGPELLLLLENIEERFADAVGSGRVV